MLSCQPDKEVIMFSREMHKKRRISMVYFSMLLEKLLSLCNELLHKVIDLKKRPGLIHFKIL